MKKIFYFIASAIVALGAVACQNEVDENITPGTQNDVVSFTVSFDDNTRIALGTVENGEANFEFEANETLYLNYNNEKTFEFTNTPENRNTFTGTGDGLSEIFNNNYYVTISNKEDLLSPSDMHTTFGKAAYFKFQGNINGVVTLSLSNYVIHCATGADEVTLYCNSYKAAAYMAAPESLVLPANGEYWINLKHAYTDVINVSYEINDETVKSAELDAMVNDAYGFKIFNLGDLVPAVAKVGETNYTDLSKAIAASEGTQVVTLLADATNVATACVIDANSHNLTTGDGFLALKNYNNANGYFDVVAVEKTDWQVVGNHIAENEWTPTKGTTMYTIKGTNIVVAKEVEIAANKEFKFVSAKNTSDWSTAYGSNNGTTTNTLNQWNYCGGDNIKVGTAGTYNIFFETSKKHYAVVSTDKMLPTIEYVKYYLNAGGSTYWDQGNAWFVAYFWSGNENSSPIRMTSNNDGTYYVEILKGINKNCLFRRMSSGATNTNNWGTKVDGNNDGYWNTTNNLTINGTNNCYTITGWGGADGEWSTK